MFMATLQIKHCTGVPLERHVIISCVVCNHSFNLDQHVIYRDTNYDTDDCGTYLLLKIFDFPNMVPHA